MNIEGICKNCGCDDAGFYPANLSTCKRCVIARSRERYLESFIKRGLPLPAKKKARSPEEAKAILRRKARERWHRKKLDPIWRAQHAARKRWIYHNKPKLLRIA